MPITDVSLDYLARCTSAERTSDTLRAALRVFLAELGAQHAELSTHAMLLGDALLVEHDEQSHQHLLHEQQTVRALRRELSEIEHKAHDVAPILRQLDRYRVQFAAWAAHPEHPTFPPFTVPAFTVLATPDSVTEDDGTASTP